MASFLESEGDPWAQCSPHVSFLLPVFLPGSSMQPSVQDNYSVWIHDAPRPTPAPPLTVCEVNFSGLQFLSVKGNYSCPSLVELPRELSGKNPPAMQETQVRFLGRDNPLEKETATHSSILAWRIPWTEEPGRLQSMGSHRVRHD